MPHRFRLAVQLHVEALIEQRLRHQEGLLSRRFGRGFGNDVDAQVPVANPVGSVDLIFADEVVGELDAFAQGGVGEGDGAMAVGAEIDAEWSVGGRAGFD